jgi:ABC-type lipoprotein export system ATPase subunit
VPTSVKSCGLSEALAACVGLSKVYETPTGRVEALEQVDASLYENEVTAFVGPSGSGKTSLLKILAGLERPSAGEVFVGGVDLARVGRGQLRRHRRAGVSYVSQRPIENFLPQLTLAQHAEVVGAANGTLRERFEAVGLGGRVDARPGMLSGGEQARAAFALALLRGTRLVLADEPTAELDDASAAALLEAIASTAASGVAIAIATHDPNVVAIANRVIHLERGRVVEYTPTGAANELPAPTQRLSLPVAVEAVALKKEFRLPGGIVHAVENVDLAVPRGGLSVVVGRSGSGKSTLLSLLAGWQRPDSGEVRYHVDGVARDPRLLGWETLAYVPQRFGLVPELSVRDNVELPARIRGTSELDHAWIDSLLERLGLAELAHRMPNETSVGQQQRAAVARALALRPGFVLADEPTSHQDPGWRDRVIALLKESTENGATCIVATHEPEIGRRGDSVWRMHDGRLV